MYNMVYSLFYALKRKQKSNRLTKIKDSKMLERGLDYCEHFFNDIVVKWYAKHLSKRIGVTRKKREQQIIISLTSFPGRIDTVWITIETLLRQSMKPDKVVLWLADTQFSGIEELPENLLKLRDRGLEIRFCDDLRSHKKYYYTMLEYPDDLIILADDDLFYPYDLVKKLWMLHKRNPDDIVCTSVALVPNTFEEPTFWGRTAVNQIIHHQDCVQPFTGSGTLYPARSLDDTFLFRKDLIKTLCPNADDLWLYYMQKRKGTKVTAIYKERCIPVARYGTLNDSLFLSNGLGRENDSQWKAILSYFGERND